MQKDSKLFEDIAKVASHAAGSAIGVKQEIEQYIAQKISQFLTDKQLVSREEFEVVKAMAQKARQENDALRKEIEALKK